MGHWTPTGVEPNDYDDDVDDLLNSFLLAFTPLPMTFSSAEVGPNSNANTDGGHGKIRPLDSPLMVYTWNVKETNIKYTMAACRYKTRVEYIEHM